MTGARPLVRSQGGHGPPVRAASCSVSLSCSQFRPAAGWLAGTSGGGAAIERWLTMFRRCRDGMPRVMFSYWQLQDVACFCRCAACTSALPVLPSAHGVSLFCPGFVCRISCASDPLRKAGW